MFEYKTTNNLRISLLMNWHIPFVNGTKLKTECLWFFVPADTVLTTCLGTLVITNISEHSSPPRLQMQADSFLGQHHLFIYFKYIKFFDVLSLFHFKANIGYKDLRIKMLNCCTLFLGMWLSLKRKSEIFIGFLFQKSPCNKYAKQKDEKSLARFIFLDDLHHLTHVQTDFRALLLLIVCYSHILVKEERIRTSRISC